MQIGDASMTIRHEQMEMGMDLKRAHVRKRIKNDGEQSAYAQSRRGNSRRINGQHHEEAKRRREKSPCREKGTAASRTEITVIEGTLLNQEISGAVAPRPGPCKYISRPCMSR